jgi:hypothetical protein
LGFWGLGFRVQGSRVRGHTGQGSRVYVIKTGGGGGGVL